MFPSGLVFNNSTAITFARCTAGPCPTCGGDGHIPDGTFNFVGDAIEVVQASDRSRAELLRFAAALREARERGATAQEVRQVIEQQAPELKTLLDVLPRTRTELYAFITMLLALVAILTSHGDDGGESEVRPTVTLEEVIQEAMREGSGLDIRVQARPRAVHPEALQRAVRAVLDEKGAQRPDIVGSPESGGTPPGIK